jgi:hypothetical protein
MKKIINPGFVILITSFCSFVAWFLLKDEYSNGYKDIFKITSVGVLVAFLWYIFSALFSLVGFEIGTRTGGILKNSKIPSLQSNSVYIVITFLALLGCISAFASVIQSLGSLNAIYLLIVDTNANMIKHALYEDYSIGLKSLRYTAIHSFTLMVIRRVVFQKKWPLDFIPLILLLSTAIISSRLALIMSFFQIALILTIYGRLRITMTSIVLYIFIGFNILAALNYTRNFGYYQNLGLGFYEGALAEIINYVGTPFQGAISVGQNYTIIDRIPDRWDVYAGIPTNLTTNSSLLYFYRDYWGWWCFPITALLLFIYSFLAGIFYHSSSNVLILIYTSIMYCFAEFWRVSLFWGGIILSLIIVPIIAMIIVIVIQSLKRYLFSLKF